MTISQGQSRKSSFVPQPFRSGTEGNQEEFELVEPRMNQSVGALGKYGVQSTHEDKGELMADLPLGAGPTGLAALRRLHEPQGLGGSIRRRDVECLPDDIGEVVAREPLDFSHPAIVTASAHTSRKGT